MSLTTIPSACLDDSGGSLKLLEVAWAKIIDYELSTEWFKTTHEDFQNDMITEFKNLPLQMVAQIAFMQEIANTIETHLELVLLGPDDGLPIKRSKIC